MKITLCLLAKNAAQTVGRMLESVEGVYDELVALDTGSQDDTPSMLVEYGARLLPTAETVWYLAPQDSPDGEGRIDFAACRNKLLAAATGDWVVSLDADEWAHEGEYWRQAVEGSAEIGYDALVFAQHAVDSAGRLAEVAQCVRAFRRAPEVFWVRPVHNYVTGYARPYVPDLHIFAAYDDLRSRWERSMPALLRLHVEHPEDYDVPMYIAKAFLSMGAFATAEGWAKQAAVIAGAAGVEEATSNAWAIFARACVCRRGAAGAKQVCGLPSDAPDYWWAVAKAALERWEQRSRASTPGWPSTTVNFVALSPQARGMLGMH